MSVLLQWPKYLLPTEWIAELLHKRHFYTSATTFGTKSVPSTHIIAPWWAGVQKKNRALTLRLKLFNPNVKRFPPQKKNTSVMPCSFIMVKKNFNWTKYFEMLTMLHKFCCWMMHFFTAQRDICILFETGSHCHLFATIFIPAIHKVKIHLVSKGHKDINPHAGKNCWI